MTTEIDGFKIPDARDLEPFVVDHAFTSAREFVGALNGRCPLWWNSRAEWIFRGHGDADWPLLPSAHRADSWARFPADDGSLHDPAAKSDQDRISAEIELLRQFIETADASGLPLPGNHFSSAAWEKQGSYSPWPDDELIPAMALAQHHGIPTRLLDWSKRSLTAAYFAALEPRKKKADHLCVWALNATFARDCAQIRVVSAPRASNPYLHAQAGVFTIVDEYRTSTNQLRVVNKVMSDRAVERQADLGLAAVVRRLTLPRALASDLVAELELDGVSGLTLFPGFSGVVEHVASRRQRGLKP